MRETDLTKLAVIFDLDGVLVDSYRAHLQSWLDLGKEYGNKMTETLFPTKLLLFQKAARYGRQSKKLIDELEHSL